MLQMIKTVKIQQSTQKLGIPDDDQKYGQKSMGRTYGTILLPPRSRHKKIARKLEKLQLKIINNV